MKAKFWIFLPILSLSIGSAFAATENADQAKVDGEIIKDIIVIDQNEIAAADLALKKNSNKEIKNYAQYLKGEHTNNLNTSLKMSKKIGIQPLDSDASKGLQEDGQKLAEQLKGLNGKDFDKTYIDDMVTDHKSALQLIDNDLLKNVTNSSVKKLVQDTRIHVNSHLQKALKIQSEMKA